MRNFLLNNLKQQNKSHENIKKKCYRGVIKLPSLYEKIAKLSLNFLRSINFYLFLKS